MEDGEAVEVEPGREVAVGVGRVPLGLILRGLAFGSLALGVLLGMHAYLGARLIGGAGLTGLSSDLAWGALWTLFLSLFGALILARRLPRRLSVPLHLLAYSWMGLFALTFCAVVLVDAGALVAAVVRGLPVAARWGPGTSALAAGLAAGAFAWGAFRALAPARVTRVRVPIAGLPAELDGYRIVQISDLHVGDLVGRGFASRVTRQVNALAADAVAITGDLADGPPARVAEEVAPLGGLTARDGVFFVTGNHEYFNGLGGWLAEARRHGWQVLLNEHRVVSRGDAKLVIAGVTDHDAAGFVGGHASSPAAALEGAPAGAPRVLLAHQPRTAFQAGGLGVDLQLSGHTHGGQFFPWKYFVRLQQPVLAGLATIGGVRVYTHRGTGFWGPPVRLLAPPEIAEITLVRAPG